MQEELITSEKYWDKILPFQGKPKGIDRSTNGEIRDER